MALKSTFYCSFVNIALIMLKLSKFIIYYNFFDFETIFLYNCLMKKKITQGACFNENLKSSKFFL